MPPNSLKSARLSIWIAKKPVLQGKFYWLDKRPIFLFNVDKNKLWRNYNGYSIATQLLEVFSELKLRVTIIYKNIETGEKWSATPSDFYKYGIPVSWGSHRQLVLPIAKWKAFRLNLEEPFNLPKMTIDDWKQTKPQQQQLMDCSMPLNVWEELKKRHPEVIAKIRGSIPTGS